MKFNRTAVALLFLLLLVGATSSHAATLSIAAARALPDGTVVSVEGYASVPSGIYSSSTFDQGFAVEDGTAGIYVSSSFNSGVRLNNHIRVTGTVGDDGFGQFVLRPAAAADVVRLNGASRVHADEVDTGDVGEATEGSLIEIEGVVTRPVVDDLPFGYKVFIDDGSGEVQIFIPASTGINPFNIPFIRPGREISAVGLSSQFLSEIEVLPRFRGDIRREN